MDVFISQPMKGKSIEDITIRRESIVDALEEQNFNVVNKDLFDSFYTYNAKHNDVYCLGESLTKLADCDIIYMCKDWEKFSGCMIEFLTAVSYGIEVMYEQ